MRAENTPCSAFFLEFSCYNVWVLKCGDKVGCCDWPSRAGVSKGNPVSNSQDG